MSIVKKKKSLTLAGGFLSELLIVQVRLLDGVIAPASGAGHRRETNPAHYTELCPELTIGWVSRQQDKTDQ